MGEPQDSSGMLPHRAEAAAAQLDLAAVGAVADADALRLYVPVKRCGRPGFKLVAFLLPWSNT